ncbi:50S ribosomal protein L1 [Candidatus Dojkabacteria bacterium]|uniref:Ribosomal protein n=1 Tax=Candidatus Dojkabacteria bacterium TaxID=2099670 RepID=A0A847VDH2_9BACT|nr:50S ribosomal protein L1 [Candidatus Dojkabacteria bacterium]
MKRGKKYRKVAENLDRTKIYSLEEAVTKVKETSYSSFVGSLEAHFNIKIPKDTDPKSLKGALTLPHQTDVKKIVIAVFTTPEKEKEAKEAGADYVGLDNLIKEIQAGKISFDIVIASPSVMSKIAILGKELGPKGLMPNPKSGTVTDNIAETVKEYKKGKQPFSCDSTGVIHIKVGRLDMEDEKLIENIHATVDAIEQVIGKQYPQAVSKLHITPTIGPSFKVDYKKKE